ncbi:hypothetical protein EV401DRAFT_2067640 [Pisolithus croceorrhizus]|nr:hypothetical protein EV401DRAFT_2067640 [Pisolithus croceorrhizus]
MVKLSLISPKGNQGIRYFPHHGYLGLTPVKVEGLVRTNVEQDGKPILAKDITVAIRCYEARYGRFGTVHLNVLFEHVLTLWHKDGNQDWSEIGDRRTPVSIIHPVRCRRAQHGSLLSGISHILARRRQTVLNHVPIASVGSRQVKYFELPLIRYDLSIHPSPSILAPSPVAYNPFILIQITWCTLALSYSRPPKSSRSS